MAKTNKGKKVVPVEPYTRKQNGKTIRVKRHKRSLINAQPATALLQIKGILLS